MAEKRNAGVGADRMGEVPVFVPGLALAEGFFREEIGPILAAHFPDLSFSAALIGSGSEVLGLDTEMSVDHDWGPRAMLFLPRADLEARGAAIGDTLSRELPSSYRGYPTSFTEPDPADNDTQVLRRVDGGPVNHRVEMFTLGGYFARYMGIRLEEELAPADWLALPHHKLRAISAGRLFRDDLGLEEIRARLAWYPRDVWLYLLASAWTRIGQEEHLMGRAGSAGDEIGSALIGARLARDVMRLAFLMEREYPPYAKWFGTAFAQLRSASRLRPDLEAALHAGSWQERESSLGHCFEALAEMHNALGLTDPLDVEVSPFFGRPFKVIGGDRFAEAIKRSIEDPEVRGLARQRLIGSVDLFSDSTDLLESAGLGGVMRALHDGRAASKSEITLRLYDETRLEFHERNRDRSRLRRMLDEFAAQVDPGGIVLDVGCGPGFDTAGLRSRGFTAVGVDLSGPMLRVGHEKYPGPYCRADMRSMPFLRRVAGIWACASMLHLQRREFAEVLAQFARVLRPGGVVSLSVKEGEGAGWDHHFGQELPRWFTYWTDATLDVALAAAHFEIIASSETPGRRQTWLRRLVRLND